MAAHSVKIVDVEGHSWAKSPQTPGRVGTIVFDHTTASPSSWERWVIDSSNGPQKVTIQNTGSGLFAFAQGNHVITISASVVPPQRLYWDIQPHASEGFYAIGVPNQNLYWTLVEGGQVILSEANSGAGRQIFTTCNE